MRLLLDSHAVIWAVDAPSRLGPRAVVELADAENDLLLSAGTIWEIAIKVGLKKLALSLPFREWMAGAIAELGLAFLPSYRRADWLVVRAERTQFALQGRLSRRSRR